MIVASDDDLRSPVPIEIPDGRGGPDEGLDREGPPHPAAPPIEQVEPLVADAECDLKLPVAIDITEGW